MEDDALRHRIKRALPNLLCCGDSFEECGGSNGYADVHGGSVYERLGVLLARDLFDGEHSTAAVARHETSNDEAIRLRIADPNACDSTGDLGRGLRHDASTRVALERPDALFLGRANRDDAARGPNAPVSARAARSSASSSDSAECTTAASRATTASRSAWRRTRSWISTCPIARPTCVATDAASSTSPLVHRRGRSP